MRLLFPVLFLLTITCHGLRAETDAPGSAFSALKLLPRGDGKRLARIEAREGTPIPERWHFIVHDPKSETGVHEYVVAGGEIVASREVSQFVESLRAEDVFGSDALKINSDRAAKLAQQYAFANNATVATMHYELKKEGAAAAPLWSVTCLDDAGKEIGRLVLSAGKGNVIAHPGFAAEPPPPVAPLPATPKPEEKPHPTTPTPKPALVPKATPMPVMVAEPVEPPAATPPPKKRGLFDRLLRRTE